MSDDLISCVFDKNENKLRCVEPDGSMIEYNIGTLPSPRSMKMKQTAINELLQQGKACFDSGKCKEPIETTFFSLESCGHCASHTEVLKNVEQFFKEASIPFTITKKNARKHLDEFKTIACNGAPCVAIKKGGTQVKLYEGNKGEVGVIADMLGLPNPLFIKKRPLK